MKKIVFLGSKEVGLSSLLCLINSQHILGFSIVAIGGGNKLMDDPSRNTKSIAQENNIPFIHSSDELLKLDFDILISVQYHEILKAKHIEQAKETAFNLHMAPLPEYRGCNQFSFAIAQNAQTFGTTLHIMNPKIDNGAIVFEDRFEINSEWGVKQLRDETILRSIKLFENSLPNLISGNYTTLPQENLIEERGSQLIFRKDINKLKVIDLNWPEEKIDRIIKATYFPPFDPPYTIVNGKKINLSPAWRTEIENL